MMVKAYILYLFFNVFIVYISYVTLCKKSVLFFQSESKMVTEYLQSSY
jgi:hypothetical protein